MKMKLRTSTIITFLIVLAFGGFSLVQRRKSDARPPIIERKVEATIASGVAPAPEFLLQHKKELALTVKQEQLITELATAYRRDIAPAQRQMDTAAKEYRQFMTQAQKENHSDTEKLREHGGDVQRLSGVIAATRQAYWRHAQAMLTEEQLRKVDGLLPQATIKDLR